MIGFAVLGMVALMAMHSQIIGLIVPTLHEKINYMPTIYTYDENNEKDRNNETEDQRKTRVNFNESNDDKIKDIRSEIDDLEKQKLAAIKIDDIESVNQLREIIKEQNEKLTNLGYEPVPNINLQLYWMFGDFARILFLIFLFGSIVILALERFNFGVKRGTAVKIFKGSIIALVVIHATPEIWDPLATTIQRIGLHMLDPIDGQPHETTTKLWCRMGSCMGDSKHLLDEDVHKMLAAKPKNYGEEFFVDIFMGMFRLTATSMMSLMFFITATVRITFTLIILITLPLWLVFHYIPPLKKLSQAVISSFIGACLAPILVSTVLYVGEQYMVGHPDGALTEWITVLSIATLAQTFLLILAPILSSVISQASSTVQTGIQSTTMAASNAGAAAGGAGARAYDSGGSRGTGGSGGREGSAPSGGGGRSFGSTGSSPGPNPLSRGRRTLNIGKAMAPAAAFAAAEGLTGTRVAGEVKSHFQEDDSAQDNSQDDIQDDIQDDDEK